MRYLLASMWAGGWRCLVMLGAACHLGATLAVPVSESAAALSDQYTLLGSQLQQNAFQRPLVLLSTETQQGLRGDIYALMPFPFGAVSTALNSVRGGAQACLAGQTDSVSAVVTFASDGHVLRVSASGSSAACIQAALSKARIAPFAKESFSATTTIRPP